MCWTVAYDLVDSSLLWFYLKYYLLLVIEGIRHDETLS
jgi:hypothetical protein